MNFSNVFSTIEQYNSDDHRSEMSRQLKLLIDTHGFALFEDKEALCEEIRKTKLPMKSKAQLMLVFSCSSLSNYVLNSKTGLNLVDIDNIVHNIVDTTGLTYKTVIMIVADVLSACGISFAVEYGPTFKDGKISKTLHAMMPSDVVEKEVKKVTTLYNSYKASTINKDEEKEVCNKITSGILRLCSAGVADGFYLLGCLYMNGDCDTDKDSKKAMKLMKTAAEMGHSTAASLLGNFYYYSKDFFERDYTLAHFYYTKPGAAPLDTDSRKALSDIYAQGSENKKTLVFSAILTVFTALFVALFNKGLSSGADRIVFGIISVIISAAVFIFEVIYHKRKKYNGMRLFVAAQFFIWLVYSLVLCLS